MTYATNNDCGHSDKSICGYCVPRPLKIRFVRGMAWDSKVVEWQTRGWCSHVELYDEASNGEGYTFGAQLRGGVLWRQVNEHCYSNVARFETWQLNLTDYQNKQMQDFINETYGKPYDWRAIISFALGERDWREPDSWFCSELVAALLERLEIARFSDDSRITPIMLYEVVVNLQVARALVRRSADEPW